MIDVRAQRIGIMLHDFPAGGTERIVIRLANDWAARGREVTIFCGLKAGPALAQLGPSVRVIEAARPIPRSALSRFRLGTALKRMIARSPVDVLVVPGNFHIPILATAGAPDCAIVCKISNPLLRRGRGRAAERFLRFATRHVDGLVAMSPNLAHEITAILDTPITTIAEPVAQPTRATRAASSPPVFVYAGRMVAQKALDRALRAFALLGDTGARLLLLGDGPERPRLEGQAKALGITDRTTFVGLVPSIAPYLKGATGLVLTSRYEGYPAVLVESILAGVPVITTRCSPAVAEILFDKSFGVVTGDEPLAIAEGVRAVIAQNGIDEIQRRLLAERHDVRTCSDRWLAMLDRTVAARMRENEPATIRQPEEPHAVHALAPSI